MVAEKQEEFLAILEFILNQISNDSPYKCRDVIFNVQKNLKDLYEKSVTIEKALIVLSSLKVLLKLYEKFCKENQENLYPMSLNLICQDLKYLLEKDINNCLSHHEIQRNFIEILSLLLKITIIQDSENDYIELLRFYNYCLDSFNTKNEPEKSVVIFKIKIFCVFYEVFNSVSELNSKTLKKFKIGFNNKEKFLTNLIVHGSYDTAVQALLFAIPQYVNFIKTQEIFKLIWVEIKNYLSYQISSEINYNRILLFLCHLFDFCFDKYKWEQDTNLLLFFIEDNTYWELIQFGLKEKGAVINKQAMYLFKKSVNLASVSQVSVKFDDSSKKTFMWDSKMKTEFCEVYREIITILEFLDEQQIHIIEPVFQKIEKLVQKILSMQKNSVDFSWIFLIYQKALLHDSIKVVKWGLFNLLLLPDLFFSDEFMINNVVCFLLPVLNNVSLYYKNGMDVSEALSVFLKKMRNLVTGKTFFSLFISELCKLTWSPEALFFVSKALPNDEKHLFWSEREIFDVKNFIGKAFKTHNKSIRAGVQYYLLKAIIKLTDEKNISLVNVFPLLSNFSDSDVLVAKNELWNEVIDWLSNSYSKSEIENILVKYKTGDLFNIYSEQTISLMLLLTSDIFESKINNQDSNISVCSILSEILSSFYSIGKRLYCDDSSYISHLTIIYHVMEENCACPECEDLYLLNLIMPFFVNITNYIGSKVTIVSNIQDYYSCSLCIKLFESFLRNISKQKVFSVTLLYSFYLNLISVLVSNTDVPPIRTYFVMNLLKIVYDHEFDFELFPKCDIILRYLIDNVNKPLIKNDDCSGITTDLQVLWGKMNSEFLEAKWEIFKVFVNTQKLEFCKKFLKEEDLEKLSDDELIRVCEKAITVGSYKVLGPVMTILKNLIPKLNDALQATRLIDSIWQLITERRRSNDFRELVKKFVKMLFQEKIFNKSEILRNKLFQYTNIIFMDSSLYVIKIFVEHILEIELTDNIEPLFSQVVGKALIFGPVQQKDERLTSEICSYIKKIKMFSESATCCKSSKSFMYITANEIRATAIARICDEDRPILEKLFDILIELEKESTSNKIRYFGDSHIHRVKHRVAQALLILAVIIQGSKEIDRKLFDWTYHSLMENNPQPSVKYLLQWLLCKILLWDANLCKRFNSHYFANFENKKAKELCSLIAVMYFSTSFKFLSGTEIQEIFEKLFALSMDQHFEVRLYTQVVMRKFIENNLLYKIHIGTDLRDFIMNSLRHYDKRMLTGNAAKNYIKLKEDFYFKEFNPERNFDLQTIYWDLPRLANVGSDEWISLEMLQACGLNSKKSYISLHNLEHSLQNVKAAEWLVEKTHLGDHFEDFNLSENYQKKMIPSKPLLFSQENAINEDSGKIKKDGLVVVASLIDRVPNLGGLARTCEIFGASEYVINSLKYIESKEFTSLSVTAEKWLQVKEVKLQNLFNYILEMKELGYTVIGAEQALHSQSLSDVKLPKKSVLLLGNEKEGIPPNLLPLLDICVEIPQLGIIRSLNVHVTGALIIWEYAKQNCLPASSKHVE